MCVSSCAVKRQHQVVVQGHVCLLDAFCVQCGAMDVDCLSALCSAFPLHPDTLLVHDLQQYSILLALQGLVWLAVQRAAMLSSSSARMATGRSLLTGAS